jgi:hypothetical protein
LDGEAGKKHSKAGEANMGESGCVRRKTRQHSIKRVKVDVLNRDWLILHELQLTSSSLIAAI